MPASADTPTGSTKAVRAGRRLDANGAPKGYTLALGQETIPLEPGRPWAQADHYKWVTRGLIEIPQSYHVMPDGTVEINGEKIAPQDPEGLSKLEHEVNKRHVAMAAQEASPAAAQPDRPAAAPVRKEHFRVRLDHTRHLMVECQRGGERIETGLRGINTLVQNGLMLAPTQVHVDPLQRYFELEGHRFECNESGAAGLERMLNARFVPTQTADATAGIEIRENPASATGFDLRFVTLRAGARVEVKGHLSQENLDLLQDPAKCELLRPGVLLRLTPPHLLFRRRRPDGGEEPIPDLPDVLYRRCTAPHLQQLLNHPIIRRAAPGAGPEATPTLGAAPHNEIVAFRLGRHPQNKQGLWLECVQSDGAITGRAWTHHNLAELQHAAVFQAQLEVALSLDHQQLRVLDRQTRTESRFTVQSGSPDEELAEVSRMLTAALKPPVPRPATVAAAVPPSGGSSASPEPARPQAEQLLTTVASAGGSPPAGGSPRASGTAPVAPESPGPPGAQAEPVPTHSALPPASPSAARIEEPESRAARDDLKPPKVPPVATAASVDSASPEAALDPAWARLFGVTDAVQVNVEVFRSVATRLGIPVQSVQLSLERAFVDRRFEVISFGVGEVETVMDLRDEGFYGFYLSHINEHKILLVYACQGKHLEWGPDRCLLQPAVTAEPSEFRGRALLGLAQSAESHFVFVVEPSFRSWVRHHEKAYLDVFAQFRTVQELAADAAAYALIWPESGAATSSSDAAVAG